MKAPIAKKIPLNIEQHDTIRVDNYFWMRDQNWKKFIDGDLDFADEDCLNYINAENEYKDKMMADYKDVEKSLYDEILSRIKEDDESFPTKKGDFHYYSRQEKGKNYSILCRKFQDLNAPEQIYFDINEEAKGKDLYIFGPSKINNAQTTMAYFYNETGSLEKTLRVRDLETGAEKDWEFENSTGSLCWIDDENFYVVERDEFSRGKQVYKINVNEGLASKKLVFTKPEQYQDMFMGLSTTNDEEYFILELESGATSVVYLSKKGSDEFVEFIKGEDDIKFDLDHYQGDFYINTNMNGARNFKVMKCRADRDGWDPSLWTEYIGESEKIDIEGLVFYNKFLILTRKDNNRALSEINVIDTQTMKSQIISMPDEAYDLEFIGDWDHLATKVRLIMDSPVSPYKYLELDLETMKLKELYMKDIPNYDASKYVVKREFAKARDGQEVPVTIVHLKDLKLDGTNKAMVYSYGSYGYGMPSYFSPNIFPIVDRGFVYCVAHIRGGDDKGNDWYLDGKMDKKMNTFYDFIDTCEHLVERGYTTKGEIAINGGSAGGLLMGAVSNLGPDLFKAVVADVAFVDVINTISDETLPLTPPEWEEWGNPIESKKDFDYMMQYSPYDNIEAKDYPATLYNSGISDEQVTYWEPTKMVAKLRELKTDDNLLLLNMKMHAGHAGASKRYEWISEYAFKYAFILKAFNTK